MGGAQAGTRPPAKSYGGKTAAHAQSVPRVDRPLVGSVGERLYLYLSTTKRTRGPLKMSQEGEDHDMEQVRDPLGDQTLPTHSMGHTMTTMVEGFVTRLDARRDGEPANSEVAEASPLPVGMIHKQ